MNVNGFVQKVLLLPAKHAKTAKLFFSRLADNDLLFCARPVSIDKAIVETTKKAANDELHH